jgi:hypothetical protein
MVCLRQRTAAQANNLHENKRHIKYNYKAGDQVLVLTQQFDPKMKLHEGPYKVESYNKANPVQELYRAN